MGESAGAQSIVIHMQSWRESKPKFQQAIIMSSAPASVTVDLSQAEQFGEEMVETLGCNLSTQ
jgi:carboxylesterase type B